MSYYSTLSTEKRLYAANLALRNAQKDRQLQEALARVHYDADRIAEGVALLEQASVLHHIMHLERGDQAAATDVLQKAWGEAGALYARHLAHARLVFRDDAPTLKLLGANGRRRTSLDGWLSQARRFYKTLLDNPDLTARMAAFGVDETSLREGQNEVETVENAHHARATEQAEAQMAREKRDEAMAKLDAWMSLFFGFARQATVDQPQLLEKLGIRVPS